MMKTRLMRQRTDDSIFDEAVGPDDSDEEKRRRSGDENAAASQTQTSEVGDSRCLALEQAYVHDVYAQIARECGACSPVRSHIKEFIFEELEYGALLMDVGCGDGKYLNLNSGVFTIGMEHCGDWFSQDARLNNTQPIRRDFLLGDVLCIPIRDEFFDGALCCGVLHHISTLERRIFALRELGRLLRVGGKLLISVWAFEGRELGSQDVLIKWNSSRAKSRNKNRLGDDSSGSESDDDSCTTTSSCSTTTANYVNRRAAYESCNSPTSEFGSCYSFVRRALQKFNLAPTTFYHASRRASKSSTNKETSTSGYEDMPIELRNIDENAPPPPPVTVAPIPNILSQNNNNLVNNASGKRNSLLSNNNDNSRRNSRESIKEHYGSLVSLIKEHILPKSASKTKLVEKSPEKKARANGLLYHRFSLPTVPSFRRTSASERFTPSISVTKELSPEKSPVEECEEESKCLNPVASSPSVDHSDELPDQLAELGVHRAAKEVAILKKCAILKKREVFGKVMQKSLSSDSIDSRNSLSKQQSINTDSTTTGTTLSTSTSESSAKLVAYYSMPELRNLAKWSTGDQTLHNLRGPRNRPTLADLHPITFLEKTAAAHIKPEVRRDDSQDTQAAIDEIESSIFCLEIRQQELASVSISSASASPSPSPIPLGDGTPRLPKDKLALDLPSSQRLLTTQEKEDAKRTQRSLSVEYKAQISPSNRPPRRRFSASPSLYVPRSFIQFVQQEINLQHETHPSVDSEESFITIIPANRSCRGSVDFANDNDSDSFLDDVMLDLDHRDVMSGANSSSGDDALCENLTANQKNPLASDNTSASTASTKSLVSPISSKTPTMSQASTPSPPANLHRFFHLFRCGELEEMIEANVENLHVVRSYYSEHATSWCVVAEKVQVWTI